MRPIRAIRRACALAVIGLAIAGGAMAQQQPAQQAPNREITLQNETDLVLQNFYLFAPNSQDRGQDRLGRDTVPQGATFRLRLGRIQNCTWDTVAIFQDGSEDVRRRVDICRTQRLIYGDPALPTLEAEIANRSDTVLRELYAAPARPEPRAEDAWGPDRLGAGVIDANATFRLRMRTRDCAFDLRAVYADDREEVKQGLDLCANRTVAFDRSGIPRPPTQSVALVNRHLATVQEVYVSPSSDSDWGPDRLGAATLPQGQETVVQMEGGCEADIRIVFPNGGAEEAREVNICEQPRIVLAPGWVVQRIEETPAPATTPTPSPGSFRLRNAGPLPVVEVYAGAPGAPRGTDRLGADVVPVGDAVDLPGLEGGVCTGDLVVVFRDGREVSRPGIDLCRGEEIEVR
ncbi:hypothetical protein G3576_24285 [Roseomonas stagni]|uniref:Uncharacterized protein n=1 Tax=Falsiroseomonas algicola TaxID=2716930 RepID=A0A6M1LUL4_9PROT|nr:hypothetical protein [Falsiroseomonas algicola]NGM23154.1 hypothetical protein [Falsiroseomonas algicola]